MEKGGRVTVNVNNAARVAKSANGIKQYLLRRQNRPWCRIYLITTRGFTGETTNRYELP